MSARAASPDPEHRRRSVSRNWGLAALKVAISAGLLWLILRRFSFEELKAQVLQTHLSVLLVPFSVVLVSNLLGALQWGWLVRKAGVRVKPGRLLGLYFVGLFFNNFGIGNLGGDVYKVYSLGRREGALGPGAGATVVDRIVSAVALCSLGLVAALSALARGEVPLGVPLVTLALVVPVLVLAAVLLRTNWSTALERSMARVRPSLAQRLARLVASVHAYQERRGVLRRVFALSLLIQASRVLAHYLVGIAMGWSLHPWDLGKFFLVIPVLGLIIALPISIGGWGVREWAGVALFAPLGRDGEESVTLLALNASLTFIVSLGGGAWLLWNSFRQTLQAREHST
jgi:uncharacterized protein (TIRG00374 family)